MTLASGIMQGAARHPESLQQLLRRLPAAKWTKALLTRRTSRSAVTLDRDAHRARHCCAVRFLTFRQMRDHWAPSWPTIWVSRASSCGDQRSRFTFGSRCRRHRPMHCWSVRPCRRTRDKDQPRGNRVVGQACTGSHRFLCGLISRYDARHPSLSDLSQDVRYGLRVAECS